MDGHDCRADVKLMDAFDAAVVQVAVNDNTPYAACVNKRSKF